MLEKTLATRRSRYMLLAGLLVGGISVSAADAQSASFVGASATAAAPSATPTGKQPTAPSGVHYQPSRFSKRATLHYESNWGVDSLLVKSAESGEIIRFSYRVTDAEKAKVLNDKKAEPSLIDPKAGVKLVVPSLEKVGQLRQSSTPEAGKTYWMAFSNKGRFVKRGDRVIVVIGQFRAEGLVVD